MSSQFTTRLRDALSRCDYPALHDLTSRIMEREELVGEAKAVLASVYRSGSADERKCVVNGVLEHLFEAQGMSDRFADWKADSTLARAFAAAQEWASLVSAKRQFLRPVASACAERLRAKGFEVIGIRGDDIGTDSVVVAFRKPGEERNTELVLDCTDDLLEELGDNASPDAHAVARHADYAAEPSNWEAGEFAETQHWVHLK